MIKTANIFLSPLFYEKVKLKLRKILFLTGMWFAAGLFFSINELLKGDPASSELFLDAGLNTNSAVFAILLTSVLVGLITGCFQTFVVERMYGRQHIGKMILYNTLFYLVVYFCIFFAALHIYSSYFLMTDLSPREYRQAVLDYLSSSHALLSILIFGAFVFLSLFLLYVREKFGSNVMSQLLLGKYFYPREENRIFMFLDIRSSTAIAEKLGALKYHQFLNDFYREITYPILCKKGEIYQYVGDEITVSWSEKNGFKNLNCLECFFEIERTILKASDKFRRKYGIVPDFKAGLHYGKLVVGEIGIIKREIVYSGDTVNTTARIQELCNACGEKLIVSKDLLDNLECSNVYTIKQIGSKEIRGRQAKISLFSIHESGTSCNLPAAGLSA